MGLFTKTKKCLFCLKNEKLTREHIYPEWLTKIYPLENICFTPSFHKIEMSTSNAVADKMGINESDGRTIPYKDFVSKTVCEKCNSGWMSKLEMEVKPIIIKYLDESITTNIPLNEANALSRWAIMKILLACTAIQEKIFFSEIVYKYLKEGIIPEGFMVELISLNSKKLTSSIGGHILRVAKHINRDEMDLAASGFFKGTLQIGKTALRVSYLRTEIPIYRIQIHKTPFVIHPYDAIIPQDTHPDYAIGWAKVTDNIENHWLNEFLGLTDSYYEKE